MQIDPSRNAPVLRMAPGDTHSAPAWRLGDVLAGRLQLAADGRSLLVVDGREFELLQPPPFRPGQLVRALVTRLAPELQLRILADPAAPARQALRQALPQPGSLIPLPASLGALHTLAETLPPSLRPLLAPLLAALAEPGRLQTPQGLREAVQTSGLLLESSLARSGAPAPQDLKANLHSAATRLRAALGDGSAGDTADEPLLRLLGSLLERSEAATARLQLLQAQAAQRDGGLDLLIELPIRDGDQLESLQLRIREDRGDDHATDDAEAALQVQLALRLQGLGRLHALLRLRGQHLDARLWAEQPATLALAHEHLPLLQARLGALGLTVASLELAAGAPETAVDALPALRRGLLDEKA